MGGQWGATIPAGGAQYAAELRILLVYLSESREAEPKWGGGMGATFFIGGRPPWPPVEPPLNVGSSTADDNEDDELEHA